VHLAAPVTTAGADGLRAILTSPGQALIALDFDGTLAPIVDEPSMVRADPRAHATLLRLAARFGNVAIVTGRPPADAAALLGFTGESATVPRNLSIVGHYGLESWTPNAGVVRLVDVDDGSLDSARSALSALLSSLPAPSGTAVEDKGASLAVHVRRTADPHAALAQLAEPLSALAALHSLRLEPGLMVLELRPKGVDKGTALAALVSEHGSRAACFIGDDRADLEAFAALRRMREAGVATVAIYSGVPGATATTDAAPAESASADAVVAELVARADLVLGGPADVVSFLEGLLAAGDPH
jgi:trehalose 6-phosphate phosphatase